MNDKDILIDFLTDVNKMNLDADPDLHYTMLWLQDDKYLIEKDMELRGGNADWRKDELYNYGLNYKFENDKLVELYLSAMKLAVIPDTIKNLKNLKKLNLSNNQISHIPDEITMLEEIEDINLSKNLLKRIPDNISDLNKLKRLVISNNNLSELPVSIKSMYHLKELDISENKFEDIPEEAKELLKNGTELISDN